MPIPAYALWMLEQESRALLTRLGRVKPFVLEESMLPAAGLLPASQIAIENFLIAGRRHLRALVHEFLAWLHSPQSMMSDAEEAQRRFSMLRLRFNAVLTHFDLFNNVITQRSESETGIWLSGLDVVSADALNLGERYAAPPVICYLERGVGAAIRRAHTKMPGGGNSPAAIIKVPRERMVGSGIASSLIHEVGHQGAALLDLVESLRPVLRGMQRGSQREYRAWQFWERWISEIVADFWSVARVGVTSTLGLIGVVSLPRAFVFRINADDPHPSPWIRVKLSAAIGNALYPDPQWGRLTQLWEAYYPLTGLHPDTQQTFAMLERTMPGLVAVLVNHRPRALRGTSLTEALEVETRPPSVLRAALARWRTAPDDMYAARPTMAFAVIGQGRADGKVSPEEESVILGKLLTHWAVQSTLQALAGCAAPPKGCGCRKAVCQTH